ncbi:hypothetical protein ANCCEY_00544 [Ancylostoma ceylanicum]|uniref:Uncharacterized protein n=1 Tax=Ancylostoma ceylanicum TaxID=53326 RepID=A0A0D6MDD0_9BILA|nr:hypothetical protein ANCCEY_00544 [Ancylostoma ceylanicum]
MFPDKFLEASKVLRASSRAFLIHALLMLSCGFTRGTGTDDFFERKKQWLSYISTMKWLNVNQPNEEYKQPYEEYDGKNEKVETDERKFSAKYRAMKVWHMSNELKWREKAQFSPQIPYVYKENETQSLALYAMRHLLAMHINLHILYIFLGTGKLLAAFIFQTSKNSGCSHSSTLLGFSHMSSLEKFHVHGDVNMQYVLVCFTVAQLPVLYLLLTSKVEIASSPEHRTREQYEDIEHANSSESRIFIAIDFFAVLLLVLIYVFVLNLQAQIERTRPSQDSLKIFIDRFFSGEAMLKRTRSIRPLISRLRPNSYRRFRGRQASASTPRPTADVPKIEVTLEKSPQIQYN